MKIFLTGIIFALFSYSSNTKNVNIKDFRDINWEMNIEEVIKAEYPYSYDEDRKKYGELFYKNIHIDGRLADLTYDFSGNRIKRVTVAYKFHSDSEEKSLFNRVDLLFTATATLHQDKFKKIECWHEFNGRNLTNNLSNPCSMTKQTLESIEKYAEIHNLSHVCLTYSNIRSYVTVKYPVNKLAAYNIYNKYVGWIEYSPK